jgi:putative SOS response-associated peptidase YedK
MCGRFTLTARPEVLARSFALEEVPELAPRWNAAPGQDVATIARTLDGRRELRMRRWGLVPHWAHDRRINARAETAAVRPAFREALRLRRCVVPADGFYEWAGGRGAGPREPYYVSLPDHAPFAIAGLFERWRGEDGACLETCVLLTVAANERVRALHDRMPAILAGRDLEAWLDPMLRDPRRVTPLLVPFAGAALELVPVSRRVNRPEHDDPACIAPLQQAPEGAGAPVELGPQRAAGERSACRPAPRGPAAR